MVRVLDGLRAEIEVDLVDPVAGALVVDQGAGTELGDGEKAWTRDEFVAAGAPAPPAPGRHVGGDGQPGEIAQLPLEPRLDRQRQGAVRPGLEVQHRRQRSAQVRPRGLHPDGVHVRADQVPVPQIDARRRHCSGHHAGRLAVEVLVVGAAPGAVGEDESGLPPAPGASAALRVVGRSGRNVAQVDEVELGDVDAELHGRGAEQERQLAFPKARLAVLAVLGGHLSGVLARFEYALQVHEAAIALDEVAVHLRGKPALVEQAGPLDGAVLAVTGQPAQGVRVELIARVVSVAAIGVAGEVAGGAGVAAAAAANLLDDAVSLEGQEQEPDGLVGLDSPEGLARRQMRGERAAEVLPVGAVGGDEVATRFPCAVRRRRPTAGANPARQLSLQPVAVGADDGGNDIV